MNLSRSHEWVARRLLAYGAGLLPESETMDVEQHVRSCPECRTRLASARPTAGSDPRHLPASLVATWPRSSRRLAGAERDLVARHLHQCELCRASLEFAGHAPVLPVVRRPVPPRRARAGFSRSTWMWALGVTGAVAGAVAWLPAFAPALSGDGASGLVAVAFGRTPAPRVEFETAVDSLAPGALRLPQPGFRADAADPIDVGVITSVSGLVLVMPPSLQPPNADVGTRAITVTLSRGGREIAVHQGRFYALGDAIRLRPEGRLEGGDYDLRFALAPPEAFGTPFTWSYRLRVR